MTSEGLTRRSFIKAASLTGAAAALGTQYGGKLQKTDKAWAADASAAGQRKTYVSTCRGCIQACPCRV